MPAPKKSKAKAAKDSTSKDLKTEASKETEAPANSDETKNNQVITPLDSLERLLENKDLKLKKKLFFLTT